MPFRIPTREELKNSLGARVHKIGRKTRLKMVEELLKYATPHSALASPAERELRLPFSDPHHAHPIHFQMHDEGAGGIDEEDEARLAHQLFGAAHSSSIYLTKNQLAGALSSAIGDLTSDAAERLVEGLVNKIHEEDHAREVAAQKEKQRKAAANYLREVRARKGEIGEHGEILGEENSSTAGNFHAAGAAEEKEEKRFGEHGELLEASRRGGEPSRGLSAARAGTTFRDLHLH